MARRGTSKQTPQTLTASAQRIRLNAGAAAVKRAMGRRTQDQEEAWAYFDSVPELKHAVNFVGNCLSQLRLFIAARPQGSTDLDPVGVDSEDFPLGAEIAAAAKEELAALRSDLGGQAEILRLLAIGVEVPGEAWLVGFGPRDAVIDERTGVEVEPARRQQWQVFSTTEVVCNQQNGKVQVRPDGKTAAAVTLDPAAGDEIIRVWLRHPRFSSRADSAVLGLLNVCRILEALGQEELAVTQSRLFAGVFKIPNGIANAGPVPPLADGDTRNPVVAALQDAYRTPLNDPESMQTVEPVFVRGERDDLSSDVFGFVDVNRARDDSIAERMDKWVRRFARGINLPVEVVEGHMATTFSNAEQIDQDTFDDYLQPRAIMLVDALTVGYLRPKLYARGTFTEAEIEQVMIWFDPSALIAQPNQQAVATEGLKEGVLSGAAWRRVYRFDDTDAPDPLEILNRMATHRGMTTAGLTTALLQWLADEADVELPTTDDIVRERMAENGAPVDAAQFVSQRIAGSEGPLPAITAASRRTSDVGERLARLDEQALTRLAQAASDAMERALERAGNKLRAKVPGELRTLARSVPVHLVGPTIGQHAVLAAAGDDPEALFDGAWDGLAATFAAVVGDTQAEARRITTSAVAVDEARLAARQADALSEAWDWMARELTTVAVDRLFTPAQVPVVGDVTLTAPVGLVRQGMVRAGGTEGVEFDGPENGWVARRIDGSAAGEIATGSDVMATLKEGGATVGAYTWRHVTVSNPLPGHRALDGTTFDDYDDPALANGQPFPPFDFYFPGDHSGCRCQAVPTIDLPET